MGVPLTGHPTTGEQFATTRLERVFAECFAATFNTRLQGGATEPLYQPAREPGDVHVLHYREDYFASALHEVAHWCIAGVARRKLPDFGYWYAPDGRNPEQQRAFEAMEYKPQALEWFFCRACGYRFRVSVDNLDSAAGEVPDTGPFRQRILAQVRHWQAAGLPPRAAIFFDALCREFGTGAAASDLVFSLNGAH